MPTRRRDESARGDQVCPIEGRAGFLFRTHPGRELLAGEHVELGGDAEDHGLLEMIGGERVDMAVDEPRQQRPAFAFDDRSSLGNRRDGSNPADPSIGDQNVGSGKA